MISWILIGLLQDDSGLKWGQFQTLGKLHRAPEYRSLSLPTELMEEPVLISPGLDAAELSQALGRIYGEVRTTSVDGKEQFRILLDPEGRRSKMAREKRLARIDEVVRDRSSAGGRTERRHFPYQVGDEMFVQAGQVPVSR
ncbi:MAG TPA: hypothetical protein PLO61_10320 [Fimbriimonadaceae bacterium]|nr:hypothetical protein [Fimbriimonadaceae bacterium]HRJ33995.1 hypothetical protein [Fimbriimonadaceae bacterium]